MRRRRYAPPATLNLGLSAWRYVSRKDKVWRLVRHQTQRAIQGAAAAVTPTAKRNSYRVARLVGRLPRVTDYARNPGLGKRNSVRVAAA